MADRHTQLLCVEIIHSHFGPLTAVRGKSCWNSKQQMSDSSFLTKETIFDSARSRTALTGADNSLLRIETSNGASVYHHPYSAQHTLAYEGKRRCGNVRGQYKRMPYANTIREVHLAG